MALFLFVILFVSAFLLLLCTVFMSEKYIKILAANSFTTNAIVFIALFALEIKDSTVLDIALVYSLINFVATLGISKFILYNSNIKHGK